MKCPVLNGSKAANQISVPLFYVIGKLSSIILLEVPQVSALAALLFNIFINSLSENCSKFLLFIDDLKNYQDMMSVEDFKALQG